MNFQSNEPMVMGSPPSPQAYLPSYLLGDTSLSQKESLSPKSPLQTTTPSKRKSLNVSFATPAATEVRQTPSSSILNKEKVSKTSKPPTIGLIDDVRSPMNASMSFVDAKDTSISESSSDLCVTVFGFAPASASSVLQHMAQYGSIVRQECPPNKNWMHLQYQNKMQANRALSKNARKIEMNLMIGVTPCVEASFCENNQVQSTMRPLNAAYETVTKDTAVFQVAGTPTKSDSIVGKAMEYFLGW